MLLSTWQRYELEMKQTRQFGYLAKNRLVIWRSFVWLFGETLPRGSVRNVGLLLGFHCEWETL
jgi:hypothetical protein